MNSTVKYSNKMEYNWKMIGIVVVVLLLGVMYYQYYNKNENMDAYYLNENENEKAEQLYKSPDEKDKITVGCDKDNSGLFLSSSLLPKHGQDDTFFKNMQQKDLTGVAVIDNKMIGVDTKGSTLRNANRQFRPDPFIPKKDVCPWMNSTIDPQTN